jgi:hypothetical protein
MKAKLKRNIIPFLLGALVGVGGLMGFQYLGGADKLSIMQHLQGDSTKVSAAKADSAARIAAAPDSLPSVAVDTSAAAVDSAGMPVDTAGAAGFGMAPVDSTVPTNRLPPQRLAKFFGSMQAKQAAQVLEKMTDGEVQSILAQLSDREAASIMSSLTPDRAAQLSQVVIRGERSLR